MEFFASLNSRATEQDLQQQLRIETLAHFCASIYEAMGGEGERGEISTLWGLFEVQRQLIRGGVRFSLPGCLNAVVWTITISADDSLEEVTVHCTINRKQHDADFIESLEDFIQDWRRGLAEHLQVATIAGERNRA
ncbi:hypothetical protein MNBD_GAMMA24-1176 [hydrothermal vent metagenome]|uniref:Uncharacterized protein n=1 Tax=hydrothermal vent metagenome TaxID=652676 RepID=A0A3B1B4H9_9ZZZZ